MRRGLSIVLNPRVMGVGPGKAVQTGAAVHHLFNELREWGMLLMIASGAALIIAGVVVVALNSGAGLLVRIALAAVASLAWIALAQCVMRWVKSLRALHTLERQLKARQP